MNRFESAVRDLAALVRSRHSLVWLVSREELRAERLVSEAAASAEYAVRYWDCATGVSSPDGGKVDATMRDPSRVLAAIKDDKERAVWVLRDLHRWVDPPTVRMLKSVAREIQQAPRAEARAIVVLTPSSEVPPDVTSVTVIDAPLPDRDEVEGILDSVLESIDENTAKSAIDNGGRDRAIDAALGLTAEEVSNCYAKSLVATKRIDVDAVNSEKKRVIARERVLTWSDPEARGLKAIGGLDILKAWLVQRRVAFSPAARNYGLPAPRGLLLVGVPGCGKSLTAKAVAAAWQMPLLRLDMGALKSKYVGESEQNIRKALAVAETVAPCVLWLDEIEKALAGGAGQSADGGVSADALGSLLSWMQERTAPVFTVATANAIEQLPPELLRKGRFDELFFVDLPTAVERAAIVAASLRVYGRGKAKVDAAEVAGVTDGWTGAEIAALVPEALYRAFSDGERQIRTADLIEGAREIVPLSATMADRLKALRDWARGRCRPASRAESTDGRKKRALDL